MNYCGRLGFVSWAVLSRFELRTLFMWLCLRSRSPPPPETRLTGALVEPPARSSAGSGIGFVRSSWLAPGPPHRFVFGCFFGIASPVLLVTLVRRVLLDVALASLLRKIALANMILLVDRCIGRDVRAIGRPFGAPVSRRDGREMRHCGDSKFEVLSANAQAMKCFHHNLPEALRKLLMSLGPRPGFFGLALLSPCGRRPRHQPR